MSWQARDGIGECDWREEIVPRSGSLFPSCGRFEVKVDNQKALKLAVQKKICWFCRRPISQLHQKQ
jgi:hypothetical protein